MLLIQRRLLALATIAAGAIARTTLVGLLVTATYVGQSLLVASVIADVFEGAGLAAVGSRIAAVAGLVAVRAVLLWLRELSMIAAAGEVKVRLRDALYGKLRDLGPGHVLHLRTGEVQSTMVEGVEGLEMYYGRYLPQAIVTLVAPIGIVGYLFTVSWPIALVLLVGVVWVPWSRRLWYGLMGTHGGAHWNALSALTADFLDAMQGMMTLKAFNASGRKGVELAGQVTTVLQRTLKAMAVSLGHTGVTAVSVAVAIGASTAIAGVSLVQGRLGPYEVLVVLLLSVEAFRPSDDLSRYFHAGFLGLSASAGLFALLDAEPPVRFPQRGPAVDRRPGLELDGVTFRYPGARRPAVAGLDLRVEPGQTVALVGPSGAGKSTVVWLLARFFDPDEGVVRLDGVDVRDLPASTLRRSIAVVTQDTYLFNGSIADNLRLARPDATHAELEAAAEAANIADFVTSLPERYETHVGERGARLSGGQRQRLSIARALLSDAGVLVLDEPTSSVDAASEALIQEALDRVTHGRATLVIAHRLSTVRHADRIVVLDRGTATEQGRHAELVGQSGTYARLVAAQESS